MKGILARYAHQIAEERHPAEELINGLQAAPHLLEKFKHEFLMELVEVPEGNLGKLYYELADCYYYAACLDQQDPDAQLALFDKELAEVQFARLSNPAMNGGRIHQAFMTNYILQHRLGDPTAAKIAALVKYQWRAGGGEKDEQVEMELIMKALTRSERPKWIALLAGK